MADGLISALAYLYKKAGICHGKIRLNNILNCYGTYKFSPVECGLRNLFKQNKNPDLAFKADTHDLGKALLYATSLEDNLKEAE